MATYVVITTTTGTVSVEFNIYTQAVGYSRTKLRIDELVTVIQYNDGSVGVRARSGMLDYTFSHDGSKGLKIESVNGVAPTSHSHLFDLISSVVP